jgi:FKBP-type peptidyl-prolyl cis-trans isomerase FklB
MKSLQTALLFFVILATSCAQNPEYKKPKTQLERFSYSIGVNIATSMKEKHDLKEIDALSIAKGFQDVIYNKELDIKLLATDTILNKYFDDLQQDVLREKAADALIKGKEYMIENAKKEGVKTTDSGLQYEIMKLGNKGVQAQKDNIATIHYQASLINGEVYDSSLDKDPVTFPLNGQGTIVGLYEGIELMSIGDQYKFTIPAELAYRNDSPKGSPIPPGSTLIFIIELVKLTDIQGSEL